MKIEINYDCYLKIYIWKVWDGPDGIDYAEGSELDLGQCFEQIIKFRIMNGLTYSDNIKSEFRNYFRSIKSDT
jgi:hypothetical protein